MQPWELNAWVDEVIERGNQPIWKGQEALALSEVLRPVPKPARGSGPQKLRWDCELCESTHPVRFRPRKTGSQFDAFCRALGFPVYSPQALQFRPAEEVEADD